MARVLVADDVAANRELVATLLRYAGHELAEAGDGEEALEKVRAFKPDLVVCDILMPRMDGYEFVRHLRGLSELAHTQVIFYTATFLEEEAHALANACGVRYVLTKPCEPEEIISTVRSALAHQGTQVPAIVATPHFDREHLRLVTDKLAQKANELEQSNTRLAGLIKLGVQLASERDTTVLLDTFCDGVRNLFGAQLAVLWVQDDELDDEHWVMRSDAGAASFTVQALRGDHVFGRETARLSWFDALGGDEGLRRAVTLHVQGARCALLAPIASLHLRYGWMLLVDKHAGGCFQEDDQQTLAVQTSQLGRVYENGRLYIKVQEQLALLRLQAEVREREAALLRLEHNVARALAAADAMDTGLATVLQAVCESQRWDIGRMWHVDESASVLRLAMEWHAPEMAARSEKLPPLTVLKSGEGLAGRVWRTGEPMWIPDLHTEPRMIHRALLRTVGAASATLFPLYSGGRVFGVLSFLGRERREPDERLQASARVIGNQLGQFMQRKRAQDALKTSEHFIRSTLDSLLEHVCVIDSHGVILAVNRAWREFTHAHSEEPFCVMEGANYLQACANAHGDGAADARVMAAGIRNVIKGHQATFTMEYTCDWPATTRWFLARASRFADEGPVRVVVAHEDITERKQNEQRIRRLHRVSSVLSDINALIVRVTDLDELFRDACRIAIETGRFKMAWIGLVHRNPLRIEIVAGQHAGVADAYFKQLGPELQKHLDNNTPQTQALLDLQQSIVINDIASSTWMSLRDVSLKTGSRSAIAVPLAVGAETRGVLTLYAEELDFFDDDEIKLMHQLAGDLSFAMDHVRQAEQLNHLAYYDALTGHANNTLFHERMTQFVDAAAASSTRLAIGVLDIEHFKSINDVYGRHAGDEVLRQLAGRVLALLGDRSRMARVGPDQFGVVIQSAPHGIELLRTLEEFRDQCFKATFDSSNGSIHVSGRLGVALFPDDGADAETLFRNAEAAVKRAQRSSEQVLLYDAHASKQIADRIALERRLRDALSQDQFVLHYQPKVDAVSREIVGVEALIRWQDPTFGLVPPLQFIPLMEETGLIVEVGSWALRQAAQDRRRWIESGLVALNVAVNVSVVQLRKSDFVATVMAALGTLNEPIGIDLEITESAAMEDVGDTIAKLERLRQHGICLAIDDFGTGYSSLAYLSRLPAQVLKIDRAFTMTMNADPNTLTLVATMISLAHAMNMKVVAEGVETEEQAVTLERLHCDQLQGYLISKPVPEAALAHMLKAG
ncbi:EAL domain-containing protein [Pseudorhodoferax sp. Leaf267]|uniref:EAL domain-containing protein n=1 Tax=Pseudorhodoferax sp. Leaf267 TaxID=1736316 RepID=UPI0007002F5E|nr:EAL domain-containing protein [Pseudorhodoferax sp. Leaf267]KQP13189.1 hypothetical protein ASF43_18985 [Pseudorhodoferax sp. Leaf267]